MMKKIVLCFYVILFVNCNTHQNTHEEGEILITESRSKFVSSDFVDSIELIPLEQNDEALFGVIDKMVYKNGNFYIGDFSGIHYVFVYNELGKFIKKIGRRGKGPGEYTRISDFQIDEKNNISILSLQSKKLIKYDINNRVIDVIKLSFYANSFCKLSKDKYVFSLMKGDINYKVVVTNKEGIILKKLLKYDNNDKDDKFSKNLLKKTKNGVIFNKPVDNNIYIINTNGNIERLYKLDFGNNELNYECQMSYEKTIKYRKKNYVEYIYQTPLVCKDFIYGNLFLGKVKGVYRYDIKNKKIMLKSITPNNLLLNDINFPLDCYKDSLLFSYIDYSIFNVANNQNYLSPTEKEHVNNGGYLIIKAFLKK